MSLGTPSCATLLQIPVMDTMLHSLTRLFITMHSFRHRKRATWFCNLLSSNHAFSLLRLRSAASWSANLTVYKRDREHLTRRHVLTYTNQSLLADSIIYLWVAGESFWVTKTCRRPIPSLSCRTPVSDTAPLSPVTPSCLILIPGDANIAIDVPVSRNIPVSKGRRALGEAWLRVGAIIAEFNISGYGVAR